MMHALRRSGGGTIFRDAKGARQGQSPTLPEARCDTWFARGLHAGVIFQPVESFAGFGQGRKVTYVLSPIIEEMPSIGLLIEFHDELLLFQGQL